MRILWGAALACVVLSAACTDDKYSVEKLQDPGTCMECHPKHYTQWSGSMHAYASEDPVFLAMNARGQRDTGGALGDFCIQCHAPMALKLGLASGANFDPSTLPAAAKGVTCYFCHDVDKVTADHNNGLQLADDQTMRGGVKNPTDSPAHHSKYDTLMAGRKNNSEICGSCHDVTTPADVHIERSFAEWQMTVFAMPDPDPMTFRHQTCGSCHMFPSDEPIASGTGFSIGHHTDGFHEHTLGAVDQALTDFPDTDEQARVVQRDLDSALAIVGLPPNTGSQSRYGGICVMQDTISVRLDTINVGHKFPSGASQDRRSWVEVKAYNAAGDVIFQSGVVPDDKDPEDINDQYVNCTLPGNYSCSGFWDRTVKADGQPAHFFWEVVNPEDSRLLLAQTVLEPGATGYDHSTTVKYLVGPSIVQQTDRVEAKLRIRPVPLHALDDLISSGDLDPAVKTRIMTKDSAAAMSVWTKATAATGLASSTGVAGQFGCNPQ